MEGLKRQAALVISKRSRQLEKNMKFLPGKTLAAEFLPLGGEGTFGAQVVVYEKYVPSIPLPNTTWLHSLAPLHSRFAGLSVVQDEHRKKEEN